MLRSIPLTHLVAGIVTLGAAHACYYYYYIEDPNNFAYRYCSVGCGESVKPGDANYAQCCVPLSSGAPTPSTCTVLASSASAAGTMCSWSAVPTTDMKPPTTSRPTTNKINAMPTASCETTWVTMTAIPSACPPTQTPIVSSSSRFSSYSPPSTSKIEALPTSDIYTPPRPSPMTFPTPTSDLTISNEPTPSLDKPEPPSYKANNTPLPSPPTLEYSPPPVLSTTPTFTSSSIWSSSSSSTASTSEIKVEPTCKCGPLPQGAGSLPPAGFSRRSLPPDDCSCEAGALPLPEPESSTLPSTSEIKALPTSTTEPALSSTCLCPKAPVGAGSLPKEPIAKRFSGDDCVCEDESTTAMSSLPPSISEIKALPTSTPEPSPSPKCSCPPAPVGAGSLPKEPMDKRSPGDECDCGTEPSVTSIESTSTPSTSVIKALPTASHTETAPEPSCSCGPLPAGAGSLPKEPIARRSEDGKCDCREAPPAVPEPNEECDCDEGPLPMGSGSTPPDNSNWKRTQTGCNCPPKPCQEIAPVGAGATPPEGFDAMLKRDESRAVGGPGGGGVGQPGVLEAKPISEDQKFDGLRKRRLPPASLQPEEEPVPDLPSPGALMPTASTSKIKALPTSADTAPTPPPKEEPPVPSKCVTTMTTTITPSCTPVAGSGLSGAGTDHSEVEDEYDGIEDCDEDDETFDLEDPDVSNMSSAQSAGGASSTSEIAGSSGPPSATATGDSNGKDDANVPFPARPGNSAATPSESSDLEELGFGKGGSEPLDFESLE